MRVVVIGSNSLARQGCAHAVSAFAEVTTVDADAPESEIGSSTRAAAPHWVIFVDTRGELTSLAATIRENRADPPRLMLVLDTKCETAREILNEALDAGFEALVDTRSPITTLKEVLTSCDENLMWISGTLARCMGLGSRGEEPEDDGTRSGQPSDVVERNRALIELVAAGLSNKEIARSMGRSEAWVKLRLRTLMKLLNVHRRTQLVSVSQSGVIRSFSGNRHPNRYGSLQPAHTAPAGHRSTDGVSHATRETLRGRPHALTPTALAAADGNTGGHGMKSA